MNIFQKKSLRTKLVASFLLIALLPLMAVTYFGYNQARNMLAQQRAEALGMQAKQLTTELEHFYEERYGDALTFSQNPKALGTPEDITALANSYITGYSCSDFAAVLDANGTILGTNSINLNGDPVEQSTLIGKSVRDFQWFSAFSQNPPKRGEAFYYELQEKALSSLTSSDKGKNLGIIFGAPIYDSKGQITRIWAAEISHNHGARKMINEHRAFLEASGMKTSEVMLFAKNGLVLDDTIEEHIFEENLLEKGYGEAKAAVAGQSGYGIFPDPDGRAPNGFVSGYATSKGSGAYKGLDWNISIQEDIDEVWASVDQLKYLSLTAVGTVAIIVLALSFFLARSIIHPVQRAVRVLNASSGTLNKTSQQLSKNAQNTSDQATNAASVADQISTTVGAIALSVEQMNNSIRDISKNAQNAQQIAGGAVGLAENASTTITKLGESSAEIGNVVKVINSIAEQTNLLALNATIEAARAGKAGKGFSVVANEVKELAKKTAKATEDIAKKIEAIQGNTSSAVDAITKFNGIINQINDYQNTIASAVEEQTATTLEISRSISEAAQGTATIAKTASTVAATTNEAHSEVDGLHLAASTLDSAAKELNDLVEPDNSEQPQRPTLPPPPAYQDGISGKFLSGTFGIGSTKTPKAAPISVNRAQHHA